MDWTRAIDGYCERTGPEYWSEPINAITNAAFLISAAILYARTGPDRRPVQVVLIALLAMIGFGSYLFHTHAQPWAALVDVLPIGLFILAYVYAANRDFWRLPLPWAAVGTALFIPYAALTVPVFSALPFFEISAAYWPVPLLIAVYALALRRRAPETSMGLALGVAILVASLAFRSVDEAFCASDVAFHRALVDAAENPILSYQLAGAVEAMQPLMNMITFTARDRARIVALHGAIADALEQRQVDGTREGLQALEDETRRLGRDVMAQRAKRSTVTTP